jgi:hypothetical protein
MAVGEIKTVTGINPEYWSLDAEDPHSLSKTKRCPLFFGRSNTRVLIAIAIPLWLLALTFLVDSVTLLCLFSELVNVAKILEPIIKKDAEKIGEILAHIKYT